MKSLIFFAVLLLTGLCAGAQTYQEQLKAIRSNVTEQVDGKSYYIHTVKKGQTLYMISKAYGVEVNDIIAENPSVKEGLKADQKLHIPLPVQKKEESPRKTPSQTQRPPAPVAAADSQAAPVQPLLPCGSDTSARTRNWKVVLMIPLYLNEADSVNPEKATPDAIDSWNSLKFLPFYEGFRLAADSLKAAGLHLTLYVFDVGKDSLKTSQVLKKSEVKQADLIVGLLFQKPFQMVARFARENRIPLVNPLSERPDVVKDNEMVFKVVPAKNAQLEAIADFMQKKMLRNQILIIRNGNFRDKDIADRLKKECMSRNLNVTLAEGQDVAISKLSKTKDNTVVAFTDNNVYALDLMRSFYELRNDYSITLIGLPDWDRIERLDNDFLNGLGTHFAVPSFVDYSDPGVKQIMRRFQQIYKADPEPLAFQGFDVGYYFLSAMMKFGKQMPSCINDFRLRTSQADFEFSRQGKNQNNGFENRHWCIYRYEAFRLVRLD